MTKVESLALTKLAERVHAGKYVEWPWALLREHFPGKTEAAQLKAVSAWAKRVGIAYRMENHEVRAGRTVHVVRVAIFEKAQR
jgi:hypothetical protein